jgi:hypothetical protein
MAKSGTFYLIEGIKKEGGIEVNSRNRYRIFLMPSGKYYLIGSRCGLRVNSKPVVAGSIGLTGTTRGDARIKDLMELGSGLK